MGLPYFRFHPDPVKNGAIVQENIICNCCGNSSEYDYVGPFFCSNRPKSICPECIANGKAAKIFDGEFIVREDLEQAVGDVISPAILDELTQRTPGFLSAQEAIWLCLDGLPGVYEGDFNNKSEAFMTAEFWQSVKDVTEIWNEDEFEALKNGALHGSVSLHVFKDLNSDKRVAYFDFT